MLSSQQRTENPHNRRYDIPKYLFQSSMTEEGLEGLLQEGDSSRVEAVAKAAEAMGGTMEAYYFAFGETDVYVILDLPDNVSATAASLITNAAGTTITQVTVLITPEEVDQATKVANEMSGAYRPPGQ